MQRVLLLSDGAPRVAQVETALRLDGLDLRCEQSPEGCLIAVREWRPELVIVDLAIGFSAGGLAALLRDPAVEEGPAVLAIADADSLRLVGPGVAVDDFILEPLEEAELRARVGRLLHSGSGGDDETTLRHGSLMIDLERYKVTVDGSVVDLTYKEYELLRFLAQNPGKPFTREALLNRVWGYDYYGGSRTVDVHIRRIRAKIEGREAFIETVRNVGYRFVERTGR